MQKIYGSFRDPAGFVFVSDQILLRQINSSYQPHYDYLRSSGLLDHLVSQNLLLAHTEVDRQLGFASDDAYRVLKPAVIPFISYPFEWSFSQLKDAALLTLRIQLLALDHGMILKDASAYNIQFLKGRPVFIDLPSFEIYQDGNPWLAYEQFCKHFLFPLFLMASRDGALLQLLRAHIDGIPATITKNLLGCKGLLRPSSFFHVYGLSRAELGKKNFLVESDRQHRIFSVNTISGLTKWLQSCIESQHWDTAPSHWSTYYKLWIDDEQSIKKQAIVGAFLDLCPKGMLWDLGANTGAYSQLAAARGFTVVAMEADAVCVDVCYQNNQKKLPSADLLPLHVDIANPTAAFGWNGQERLALSQRGPCQVMLALALIHHLVLSGNVPFAYLAQCFSGWCQWLIIEFPGKDDPKVNVLLRHRAELAKIYVQSLFETAFETRFAIIQRQCIENSDRVVYLMKSRSFS